MEFFYSRLYIYDLMKTLPTMHLFITEICSSVIILNTIVYFPVFRHPSLYLVQNCLQ